MHIIMLFIRETINIVSDFQNISIYLFDLLFDLGFDRWKELLEFILDNLPYTILREETGVGEVGLSTRKVPRHLTIDKLANK